MVGITEARKSFSSLLRKVQRGHTVVITRRGVEIAKLVPSGELRTLITEKDRRDAREAAEQIRARARENGFGKFNWEEWKKYRDEGRK
jgi:prevent-host-death family protein